MTCSHCHGLIVEDRFRDWTARWRCVSCGHALDSPGVENLLARQQEDLLLKRATPDYWDEDAHLDSESVAGPDAPARCLQRADEPSRRKPGQHNEPVTREAVRPPAALPPSGTPRHSQRSPELPTVEVSHFTPRSSAEAAP